MENSPKKSRNEKIVPDYVENFVEASRHGDIDLAQEISLNHPEMSPNVKNKNDEYALIVAVQNMRKHIVCFLLKDERTDPNVVNDKGSTSLILCSLSCLKDDIALLLLSNPKTNVNVKNIFLVSALQNYVILNNVEMIKTLLADDRCDVNVTDPFLQTPCMKCESEIVLQLFLKHPKININFKDEDGNTSLMLTNNLVKTLTKHPKTNVWIKNNLGQTCFDVQTQEKCRGLICDRMGRDVLSKVFPLGVVTIISRMFRLFHVYDRYDFQDIVDEMGIPKNITESLPKTKLYSVVANLIVWGGEIEKGYKFFLLHQQWEVLIDAQNKYLSILQGMQIDIKKPLNQLVHEIERGDFLLKNFK